MNIHSEADYKRKFHATSERQCAALKAALEIRRFEIDLYWRRATYFWTLIAASFAGFFALAGTGDPQRSGLTFLVTCIGLLLSVGWYLANRGSKYWQDNWERHVDLLETEIIGPLYKTTVATTKFSWIKFWDGYPYSVSKVNQLISLFIVLVWLALSVAYFPGCCILQVRPWAPYVLSCVTAVFVILLLTLGRSVSGSQQRNVNFTTRTHASDEDEDAV